MDDWFARAADKTFVSCDELVETEFFHDPAQARMVHWERSMTTGVVPIAGGAHPTSCNPLYGFDVSHFKIYTGSAKEESGFKGYAEKYLGASEEEYQKNVGGLEAIRAIQLPTY
jgi:glutaconate CoA-transferase subunit A